MADNNKTNNVIKRYTRRNVGDRYSAFRPEVWLDMQERQRPMLNLFRCDIGWSSLSFLKLTEVGCGSGSDLLDFLCLGFMPENLCSIELLPERAAARDVLSARIIVHEGDATTVSISPGSQDVVFQSVVFSSLLDNGFQKELANRMWKWARPKGRTLVRFYL